MISTKFSRIGEAAAVVAVIDFIYWISIKTPEWTLWIWICFGIIFLIDWMLGGINDRWLFEVKKN